MRPVLAGSPVQQDQITENTVSEGQIPPPEMLSPGKRWKQRNQVPLLKGCVKPA